MYEDYTDSNPLTTAQVFDDADKDKKNGLQISTAARRIAKECNDTDQELGIHFDKDGRYIAAQPYNATPSGGVDAYAPGHVFHVRGRKDHGQRGHMTQHEAQIIVNAVTRYGAGTSEADLYQSLMNED